MAAPVTIDIEEEFKSTTGYGEGAHIDVTGNIGGGSLDPDDDFDGTDEKAELMKGQEEEDRDEKQSPGSSSWICLSLFSLERYQKYFDVSTGDVLSRVFWGTVPRKRPLNEVVKKNPDLYGPFWVCMTLVVMLSVALHLEKSLGFDEKWSLDFRTVTIVCAIVFVYAWVVAVVVWAFFWWRIGETSYSLLQTICMYGYSMSGYNLALFVAVIPIDWLKWLLLLLIACVTGTVLVYPFWDLLKKKKDKKMAFILGLLFALHVAVAIAFKFLCLNINISYWSPAAPAPTEDKPTIEIAPATDDIVDDSLTSNSTYLTASKNGSDASFDADIRPRELMA